MEFGQDLDCDIHICDGPVRCGANGSQIESYDFNLKAIKSFWRLESCFKRELLRNVAVNG